MPKDKTASPRQAEGPFPPEEIIEQQAWTEDEYQRHRDFIQFWFDPNPFDVQHQYFVDHQGLLGAQIAKRGYDPVKISGASDGSNFVDAEVGRGDLRITVRAPTAEQALTQAYIELLRRGEQNTWESRQRTANG